MPALIVIHDGEGDWLMGDEVNEPDEYGACEICHLSQIVHIDPNRRGA